MLVLKRTCLSEREDSRLSSSQLQSWASFSKAERRPLLRDAVSSLSTSHDRIDDRDTEALKNVHQTYDTGRKRP